MKRKISKEDYEKLSDLQKSEYVLKGNNYILNLEDDEDSMNELRESLRKERDEHKGTKSRIAELESKLSELSDAGHRKAGDVEALDKSWSEKFNKRQSELMSELETLRSGIVGSTVNGAIKSLAAKLSPKSSSLMETYLEKRIKGEFAEGSAALRILDRDGKISALSLQDLEKEILTNPEFAPIVTVTKSNGGAQRSDGQGATNLDLANADLSTLTGHIRNKIENKG